MFIGADGSTLRTPEGVLCPSVDLVRGLIRHIAPVWVRLSYGASLYKHSTPLGCRPQLNAVDDPGDVRQGVARFAAPTLES
jgi:hypothetical protein